MDTIDYAPEFHTSRWLRYFDLLGTSELIRSGNINKVFNAYQEVLEKLDGWRKRHPNVYHAWFSDTFIMYSEDNSGKSFSAIEMVARWFAFSLLYRKIPLRGALSCSHFYADRANSLYLGAAFLEAYEWGKPHRGGHIDRQGRALFHENELISEVLVLPLVLTVSTIWWSEIP